MARIVRCPSCAAMHRALAGQTQLLCDYCRSWIRCEQAVHAEELCPTGRPDRRLSERIVLDWLEKQGVRGVRLRSRRTGVHALWRLSSEAGEEFSVPATRDPHPLLRKLIPSATPMVPASQRDDALELPPLELRRAEAEEAALASFRDRDPRLATIRLLWLPYQQFSVEYPGGSFEAVHVLGFERPIHEPIPGAARRRPARPALLWGYLLVVLTLYAGAMASPSHVLAAVVLAAMLALALPVWTRWALARVDSP